MLSKSLGILILVWCVGVCIFWSQLAAAQTTLSELDWQLKRERNGIQIYLGNVPNSKFRAIRAEITVDAAIDSLVALVSDLENCSKWVAMCKEARVIERRSPLESIVYTLNDAPFPVRDREIYSRVVWSKELASGRVTMRSEAISDARFMPKPGGVRIEYAVSEWHFTPLPNGQVAIQSFAHVDPNGAIPAWLTNLLIVDAPYKTLKRLRARVQQSQYRDAPQRLFKPSRAN